jgi:hypothetical protein
LAVTFCCHSRLLPPTDSDLINVILDAATMIELERQSRKKINQSLTKIQQPPKGSKTQKDRTISNEHLHKKT